MLASYRPFCFFFFFKSQNTLVPNTYFGVLLAVLEVTAPPRSGFEGSRGIQLSGGALTGRAWRPGPIPVLLSKQQQPSPLHTPLSVESEAAAGDVYDCVLQIDWAPSQLENPWLEKQQ